MAKRKMAEIPPELIQRIEAIEARLTQGDHGDWLLTFYTPAGIADRMIICDSIGEVQMAVASAEGVLAMLGYEDRATGRINLNKVTYSAILEVSRLWLKQSEDFDEVMTKAVEWQHYGIRKQLHNEQVLLVKVTQRKHAILTTGGVFDECKLDLVGKVGRVGTVVTFAPIELNPEVNWKIPVGGN